MSAWGNALYRQIAVTCLVITFCIFAGGALRLFGFTFLRTGWSFVLHNYKLISPSFFSLSALQNPRSKSPRASKLLIVSKPPFFSGFDPSDWNPDQLVCALSDNCQAVGSQAGACQLSQSLSAPVVPRDRRVSS